MRNLRKALALLLCLCMALCACAAVLLVELIPGVVPAA